MKALHLLLIILAAGLTGCSRPQIPLPNGYSLSEHNGVYRSDYSSISNGDGEIILTGVLDFTVHAPYIYGAIPKAGANDYFILNTDSGEVIYPKNGSEYNQLLATMNLPTESRSPTINIYEIRSQKKKAYWIP